MARKALTILSIATFLATSTQVFADESCLKKYEDREQSAKKEILANAGEGGASVGVVGGATYGTYILASSAGGPIVVLVVTLAGAAYVIKTRYDNIQQINKQVAIELGPLLLYKQAKAFVDGDKKKLSDMPEELSDTVKGVVEWAKAEKKNFPENLQLALPKVIVALMDTGRLCSSNGKLSNAKDLLEILKDTEWAPTP